MMDADELGHIIRQYAGQQSIDFRPFAYGHIASYDAATHRIRVVVPSLRDDDPAPVMSGWIPMVSSQVGGGYGMQTAPFGGATVGNPTGGEQVVIGLFDKTNGAVACLGQTFNGVAVPPSTVLGTPLGPGETVIFNKSGTFWRLHGNGDVETNVQGNVIFTGQHDMTATFQGNVSITAVGTANLLSAAQVNLGAIGGKKVVRDGDSVSLGVVHATTTTVFAA